MKKIFWTNPYQRTLKTVVISTIGEELLFKETIAYSFSGGQESDKATVNGYPIVGSRMEGNNIFYLLQKKHGLAEKQEVIMEIDWERRNRLMRLHFACELILVIVNRQFGDKKPDEELEPEDIDKVIVKAGAHISEKNARVDFNLGENISTRLPAILFEYNKVVSADLPILTGFTDEETQRRFWRIPGFATVPCGGTHVRSTAEVGFVNLKRERGGKHVERIKITLKDSSPSSVAYEDDPVRTKKLLS